MDQQFENRVKKRVAEFAGFMRKSVGIPSSFIFKEIDEVFFDINKMYQVEIQKEERARKKRERQNRRG